MNQRTERSRVEELLQPSLSADSTDSTAIYSSTALFFTAFFGGYLAVTFLSAMNSQRLARLGRDLPVYVGLVAVCMVALFYYVGGAAAFETGDLAVPEGMPSVRIATTALALACFAIYYSMMRPGFKAMSLMGIDPPSPWAPAIASVVAAIAIKSLSFVLLAALLGWDISR